MDPHRSNLYIPRISRRNVLKGMGIAFALPYMESLASIVPDPAKLGVDFAPRRWATLIFANGVNTENWWVKGEGAAMELSPTLKALEPHKQDLLFLDNLHIFDDTVGVHSPYFTNFLAGEKVRRGSVPDLAESVDQFMGRTIGKATPVSSLVLGTEPAGYGLAGGKPGIYNATMSWSSRTTPIPPDVFPRQAFDRLFDTSSLVRDKSVIDFVHEQAKDIRRKVSIRDKDKLDEYMAAIRDIEQRINKATAEDRFEGWRPSIENPNIQRPEDGRYQDVEEHMKLMVDIITLAFQMDQTRIATMIFQKDVTGMSFNFLDGVSNTGMHDISHHAREANALEEYRKINEYHVKILAHMIEKMKGIDEGNGTLLDNTMILFGSTMRDGDIHDANDLPLVIAGGKNCDISHGRHIRYESLEDRRLCNLHLAMAQRMGCNINEFGNSHYPLPGLI